MANFITRLFKKKSVEFKEVTDNRVTVSESGTSGTAVYSGYFDEEYLTDLQGKEAADAYDKMRRNDSQVKLALSSVMNPIIGAQWNVEPAGDEGEQEKHAEFLKFIFFEDLDRTWDEKLREILSFITFGYSIFEKVHKLVKDNSEWGDYVGFKKLGFRSPRTIEKWNFVNKELSSITQEAYGDLEASVDMPVEDLVLFNMDQEGDNYEGIAGLRTCYGPWFRKNQYLKFMGAGIEKSAIPTPVGKYPAGQGNSGDFTRFKNALESLVSHQKNYVVLPNAEGQIWDIEFAKMNFDADKIKSAIDYEDQSIMRAFVAQFLMLGSSNTGSWALSTDQSDFFLNGIIYIANIITDKLNILGKELIDLNFGPQEAYPYLKHSGIKDKAGKEFAEVLGILKNASLLRTDDRLFTFIRERYELPEEDEESRTQPLAINPLLPPAGDKKEAPKNTAIPKEVEKEIEEEKELGEVNLSEQKRQIELSTKKLDEFYKENLPKISNDLVNQVITNFKKATDAQKVNSAKGIEPKFSAAYKKDLAVVLHEIVNMSVVKASAEFKKGAKLSEIQFKDPKYTSKNKKYVSALADGLTITQLDDLKKATILKFASSEAYTKDPSLIQQDLNEATTFKEKQIVAGAGTVGSQAYNTARENFFFDDEMKKEIESFTYMNDVPVSAICIALTGKTFSIEDSKSLQYTPPNHPNCKSFLSPNFRVAKNNPKPTGLKPSESSQKSKSLKEENNGK